jgi:hypothetical protein
VQDLGGAHSEKEAKSKCERFFYVVDGCTGTLRVSRTIGKVGEQERLLVGFESA